MAVLIDTSFLLAIADVRDENHIIARLAMQEITPPRIVPIPVVPELFYMVKTRVRYADAMRVFNQLQGSAYQLQPILPTDMTRMMAIMLQYRDSEFDFVDAAIMALSERLNINQICTFDRRDFSQFRPQYTDYLDLLP